MFKILICSLLSIFVLASCNVSFPDETLEQDAVKLIKEETQQDTSVYRFGSTLYLDVCFDDLATNDRKKVNEIYNVLQKIVSNIVRIPLSSDANIDFVIVSAFDADYKTLLRLFENVDDIKKYSHQYISREDFSERQIMEFEGPDRAREVVENKYDITIEEYVARLVVSQLNNFARTNPFLSTFLQILDLRFSHVDEKTFYFSSKKIENKKTIEILKNMLKEETVKDIQKYKLFSIKSAILLDEEKNVIMNIPLSN